MMFTNCRKRSDHFVSYLPIHGTFSILRINILCLSLSFSISQSPSFPLSAKTGGIEGIYGSQGRNNEPDQRSGGDIIERAISV